MSITEFLLARIAEDEDVALEAQLSKGYGAWEYAIVNQSGRIQTVQTTGTNPKHAEHIPITRDSEGLSDSVADHAGPHIARHDPARVLRECEAKRRIVSRCDMVLCGREHGMFAEGQAIDAADNLRALAAVYADHPDYDEEWRP